MTAPAAWIGPAGWAYDDWRGIVYPEGAGRDFDPLAYLARFFDVIEVNSSFYRPPPAAWCRSWIRRATEANPDFRFTAKLWRRFTHERGSPPGDDEVAAVRAGFDALAERDRLLSVLIQFPWSFRNGPGERRWLAAVAETFGDYPLTVEVRHASWNEPDAAEWLAGRDVALAAIDQPVHRGAIGPDVERTARRAYCRLHGRNREAWFAEGSGVEERYDYLYDADELAAWVERIRSAREDPEAEAVIAITNNHFRGKAVVNALQLKAWTNGAAVRVPAPLARAYPEALAGIGEVEESPAGEQRELF